MESHKGRRILIVAHKSIAAPALLEAIRQIMISLLPDPDSRWMLEASPARRIARHPITIVRPDTVSV